MRSDPDRYGSVAKRWEGIRSSRSDGWRRTHARCRHESTRKTARNWRQWESSRWVRMVLIASWSSSTSVITSPIRWSVCLACLSDRSRDQLRG
jgi:hypothetical protein